VLVERLGRLSAPLGVFLSPGNHEVYQGWPRVEAALRGAEIGTLLVNDSQIVRRGDAAIAIVGTGDPSGHMTGNVDVQPNVDRALANVPVGMTTIALAHNPAVWPQLAERGVALTLSGHTHAGQFAIGTWNLAARFLELSLGPYRRGDSLLYISPGTGHWGIPFRFGAGATGEVTLITLEHGAPAIVDA
jgi:predicted MPP superfamily phosphohydrolase